MQSIHTPTAMGQIELLNGDTDAIYGEGFRTMKTMYACCYCLYEIL